MPSRQPAGRRRYGRLDAGCAPYCAKSLGRGLRAWPFSDARMIQVRHRSHATFSRQPRQVRKEATVTGSCVCSESPVPGLFFEIV